jgi:peptidoglycan/LPS O-acetylase OafA/YrhL
MARILFCISLLFLLSEASLSECESKLKKWLRAWISTDDNKYTEMISYSGRGINDLGLYHQCEDMDDAHYVIFEINKSSPVLVIGLCLPDDCSKDNLWHILDHGFTKSSVKSTAVEEETLDHSFNNHINQISASIFQGEHPINLEARRRLSAASSIINRIKLPKNHIHGIGHFTGSAAFALFLCLLLMLFAVIGTVIELKGLYMRAMARKAKAAKSGSESDTSSGEVTVNSDRSLGAIKGQEKTAQQIPKWAQFFLCFSLYGNTMRLFYTKEEKRKDPLDCLSPVRCFSIGLVVMGHTNLFRATNSPILNYEDILPSFTHLYFQIILTGLMAVDSFFWLSGFLQGYLMTQQFNSHKKVNYLMLVVHRFIRILPVYMFVVFVSWALTKYMGNGPMWYAAEHMMHGDCDQIAWTFPLFLNNFILPSGSNNCLVGAWYLPNDMQFYLFSLPVMYLYVKHSRIFGWGMLLMAITFHIIANASITHDEHLKVKVTDLHNQHYFFDDLYYKPWCRIGPYAMGLLGGYVLHAFKKGKAGMEFDPLAGLIAHAINDYRAVRWGCYALGLFLINFFVFYPYDAYQHSYTWSNSANAAWNAFNRVGWAFALNLIYLPISMGHLSFIRPFLQSNWWAAPAKLVFGVYLTHMTIGQIYLYSRPCSYIFSQFTLFQEALFIYVLSFLLVIPLSLFVESPSVNLEKFIFH